MPIAQSVWLCWYLSWCYQFLVIRYPLCQLVEVNAHSLFSKWFSESGKLVCSVNFIKMCLPIFFHWNFYIYRLHSVYIFFNSSQKYWETKFVPKSFYVFCFLLKESYIALSCYVSNTNIWSININSKSVFALIAIMRWFSISFSWYSSRLLSFFRKFRKWWKKKITLCSSWLVRFIFVCLHLFDT